MKKILLLLALCSFSDSIIAQRLGDLPIGPAVDTGTYFVGTRNVGGLFSTYRWNVADIGQNFANADLTLTSYRDHDFAKYGMNWRRFNYFNFIDTNGDTTISINGPNSSPSGNMLYINSNSGFAGLRSKNHNSSVSLFSGVTTSIGCGSATWSLVGVTGINKAFLSLGTVGNIFFADSATNSIQLGVTNKGLLINYSSGVTTVNNAYGLPTADGASGAYLGTNGSGTTSFSTISTLGLITSYNGSAATGNGVPVIRAHAVHSGTTTAVTITSYVVAGNSYEVGGYLNINNVTTDSIALRVEFNDYGGVARTVDLYPNGSTLNHIGSTGPYLFPHMELMPQPGSTITLKTVLTTSGGSINYDYVGTIRQTD